MYSIIDYLKLESITDNQNTVKKGRGGLTMYLTHRYYNSNCGLMFMDI